MSGDREVFGELYELTAWQVYAYARRHADADTAEQVLSDTFLAAWRHWGRLPDPPLPWLLVTAKNAIRTQRRGHRRRRRLAQAAIDDPHFDPVVAAHPSAESEVVARQHVLNALSRLSVADREALLLTGWDGLDYTKAATVLGISRNAFATRLHRARRRVSNLLDPTTDHASLILEPRESRP